MARLTKILGYTWAALALPIVIATFVGNQFFATALATATDVQVSPWFTGDEVARSVDHDGYRTQIHRPVFDGLIGQRNEGFVQITWSPPGDALPDRIVDQIDVDGDGVSDFGVELDVAGRNARLTDRQPHVLGLEPVLDFGRDRALRVLLLNRR